MRIQIFRSRLKTNYDGPVQDSGLDIKIATLVFEVSNRVLKIIEKYALSCSNLQHSFW